MISSPSYGLGHRMLIECATGSEKIIWGIFMNLSYTSHILQIYNLKNQYALIMSCDVKTCFKYNLGLKLSTILNHMLAQLRNLGS